MVAFISVIAQGDEPTGLANLLNLDHASPTIIAILAAALVIETTLLAFLFSWTLLKTQTLPKANALVSSLTILTFVSLIASILTNSQTLQTIAATGIGAIAGAVTNVGKSSVEEEPAMLSKTLTRTRRKTRMTSVESPPPHEEPCPPGEECGEQQEVPDHGVNVDEEKDTE